MARAKNGIIKFNSGVAYVESRRGDRGRIGVDTLNEALRLASQCCGVDCCEGVLRLPDQTTGETFEIYMEDGFLKYRNSEGIVTEVTKPE